MKNFFILFFIAAIAAKAQLPVSTVPQNKKAVLEHFTAVRCGYSPDGDKIAAQIYNSDPNNVVLIQIHNGNWAVPNPGQADFRTGYGNAIGAIPGSPVNQWPSGFVNRTLWAGTTMTLSRATWANHCATIKTQSAYCNVALQGTVDAATRVLTVEAQVYYTANSPVSTNSLTIMLLEDSIHGPTANWSNYNPTNYNPDGSYNHNRVLRACITPTFGTTISNTAMGSTYNGTFTYTIPATMGPAGFSTQVLLGRLKLAAFVTETNTVTINGAYGPVSIVNNPNALDIGVSDITTIDGAFKTDAAVCAGPINSNLKFVNFGNTTVNQVVFSYNINGGTPMTYTWNGSLAPFTMAKTITLTPIPYASTSNNTLNISVISVNGSADQNPANDNFQRVVPYAVTANTLTMQMDFKHDMYGSEVGWGVYDEVTSASVIVVPPGTYPDLSAVGTLAHTHTFVINPNTCYKLVVTDSYGDGVNAGFGAGGYSLKSGSNQIIYSNGQYGLGEISLIVSANPLKITGGEIHISNLGVYPNPATNSTNLSLELAQNEHLDIVILDALGKVVFSEKRTLEAGSHDVELNTENWSAGVYNLNISSPSGTINKKIIKE